MTDKEAMKLALFALDIVKIHYTQNRHINEAIAALKEQLAPPEQEPVGWFTQARNFVPLDEFTKEEAKLYGWNELYLRPPQRTEQEPAAWIHIDPNKPKVKFLEWKENEHGYRGTWIKKPLYLHPPQRTWVGLTDEEIQAVLDKPEPFYDTMFWFARTIERKLKEKNT